MKALIIVCILIIGCSPLSQEQAEQAAESFLKDRVKFFAREANGTLGEYSIPSKTSYKEGNDWIVLLHIESKINGSVKKNDVSVRVDSKGSIKEFNGQKVG